MERQHSEGVVWEREALTREERYELLGQRGATVWFTGLPASGKSTVAAGLTVALVKRGIPAYRLDGDNLRHGLNGDLSFSHEDREENIRRAAEVARLMSDAGLVTIVSLVSPYRASRAQARSIHDGDGVPFMEVWVSTPLAECERRDPKGLYAKARAGLIKDMTGVQDPYEDPESPEVEIGMDCDTGTAIERIIASLAGRGVGRQAG